MGEPVEGRSLRAANDIPSADACPLARFAIAMGYVPWQRCEKIFEADSALKRGTAFPALDLPFCPKEVR